MRHPVITKKRITIALVLFVMVLVGGKSLLAADIERYIEVTLKDKSVVKFEYSSFQFNWESPQIKDEISCDVTTFSIAELDKIYVQSLGVDSCDQRDNQWLFEVIFKDQERDSIQGFIPMVVNEITGTVYGTTTQQTIAIENIGFLVFE